MDSSAAALLDHGAGQRDATRFIVAGRFGDEPELISHRRLDYFAAAGGRLLETADSYARGRSEELVGRWLRANPGALGIITKVGYSLSGGDIELPAEVVRRHVEGSLRRLGVPTVDVLLLHRDDPSRPVSELVETLKELVWRGYARRVGVSNWTPGRLGELAALMGDAGHVPVVSYHRSLAVPRFRDSTVPYADDAVMALVAIPVF
ncbi:aldo/keto reductase [Streptomyces sp. H27-D2]|uniref:aldo/keto reductase n=1 Tax=Streptomyces sp. H27-D2 TaxID=3046304 RepID=UPI002DBFE9BE|nr:aldo/keto reductase [Streptomyces sp. H27-D2]MEC4021097.1 aldo/keto reductase [Streptomyces sp. H27-D2]